MAQRPIISRRLTLGCALALAVSRLAVAAGEPAAPAKTKPLEPRKLDWDDLLPEKERGRPDGSVAWEHDYLSEEGPGMKQTGSFATNPKLDGVLVKVPGFVVPLLLTSEGVVSEFFLVPYFGACLHIPPPPPNQIVYVKLLKPVRIRTILEPYWISGVLKAAKKELRMASAAYSMAGEKLELYDY